MIIEKPGHTPAEKIFKYYVDCMIPQLYLIDQSFAEHFGLHTSLDDAVDNGRMNAPVPARLTVAQMADKARQGAQIALINPYDSKQIYEWIRDHISDWHDALLLDPNRRNAPVEDLATLEEFAEQLFPMARMYMETQPTNSKLFNALDRLNSRRGVRRRAYQEQAEMPKVDYTHNALAHAITDMVDKRGGKDSAGE